MAARKVLVKRLVCIEDLGDIDTLFTDKTGTLTQGRIGFVRAVPAEGIASAQLMSWGLLATDATAIGANASDLALGNSPAAHARRDAVTHYEKVAALIQDPSGARTLVVKG